MYNEDVKIKFIRDYTRSVSTAEKCECVFNEWEPYEEKWGADICTKTVEELQPCVNEQTALRVSSTGSKFACLKAYCKWSLENNIPGAKDGLLKVTHSSFEILKKRLVKNPESLQKCLNELFVPEDELTVDNIYRCFYWLAFAGLSKEDILNVKCSDVDFKRQVVVYRGVEYPIYKEGLPSFRNSVNLSQFNYDHPLYSNIIKRDRALGDTLIRGLTADINIDKITSALGSYSKKARRAGRTEMQLSHYRVWLSGLFYRAYEKEQAGYSVDFEDAAKAYMAGKEYKLDSGRNTISAKKRRVMKEYLEDYERWKLAFSL